ncbi:MAG: hypothetical protein ACOZAO_03330 [Patescibacteria group bacterium]
MQKCAFSKKFNRELNIGWLQNKYSLCKFAARLSFLFLIVSLFAQIYVTNKAAVKSVDMGDLASSKVQLEKDIQTLNLKLSEVSSLSYIEAKALANGFVPQEGAVQVLGPIPFAAATPSSL